MTSYTASKYPSLIFKVMVSSGYIGAIIAFLTTLKLTKLQFQIIGAISVALQELVSAWTDFTTSSRQDFRFHSVSSFSWVPLACGSSALKTLPSMCRQNMC